MRPHPFTLLFGSFRETRFPAIASELGPQRGLAEFVLAGSALELMRDLRPDEGLGDAVDDFVALAHAAWSFWHDGEQTVELDEERSRQLCTPVPALQPRVAGAAAATRYIQIAPRLVWGQLAERAPFEPLDGWFEAPSPAGLRMVACFGVHPERPGVSVSVADGPVPFDRQRDDGTPSFAPLMPGGDAAGLFAVASAEELLKLAWRALVFTDATPHSEQGRR